jgi:mono/diheme cytochrome c family protein
MTACGPQKMASQAKYIPLRSTNFFEDGKSERPLVEGTVPRGFERTDTAFYTGKTSQGSTQAAAPSASAVGAQSSASSQAAAIAANLASNVSPSSSGDVTAFPIEVTPAVFKRGQERFNIYCAPCHGMLGYGDGMVVRRGFRQPPSYHQDRLRQAPVGHFFDVITNGFGAMSDYAQQITPMDRWAIIAYIRGLQTSQNAKIDDVPPDQRGKLDSGGQQ